MNQAQEEIQRLKTIIESQNVEVIILEQQTAILLKDNQLFKNMRKQALKAITLLTAELKKATAKPTVEEFIKAGEAS